MLPRLTKKWQFDVNRILNQQTGTANNQAILLSIKNRLKAFTYSPWVVKGSSDSVFAALDNTDRWISSSNLVWALAGSPHSWIVLEQDGLWPGFQVLISCTAAGADSGGKLIVKTSVIGFSGGSTVADPTAVDEATLQNGVGGWYSGSTVFSRQTALHLWQSTDGQCTRIVMCQIGAVACYWLFERIANPVFGLGVPVVAQQAQGGPTYSSLSGSGVSPMQGIGHSGQVITITPTTDMLCQGTSVMANDVAFMVNDFDKSSPVWPVGLVCQSSLNRGRLGHFSDLYMAPVSMPLGASLPNETNKQFICIPNLVLPWTNGLDELRTS